MAIKCHFLQQFIFLVSPWVTMGTALLLKLFSWIFFLQDFLEDLWSRVQDLSNNGWKLESGNGASFFIKFFPLFFLGLENDVYILSLSVSLL
jgi:hypothetical protein